MKRILLLIGLYFVFLYVPDANAQVIKTSVKRIFDNSVVLLDDYQGDSSMLEEAKLGLDQVQKSNPKFSPVYHELARYFVKSGHTVGRNFRPGALEDAISALETATKLDPKYADAYELKSHVLWLQGKTSESFESLRVAERLGSKSPFLHITYGDLYDEQGNYDMAIDRYKRALSMTGLKRNAVTSASEGLIRVYLKVNRINEADQVYQNQTKNEPNSAWLHGNYAKFLLCIRDDYEKSIVESRLALNIMNYPAARLWLAGALYRKWADQILTGKDNQAEQTYIEAKSVISNDIAVTAGAGSCKPLEKIRDAKAMIANKNKLSPPK